MAALLAALALCAGLAASAPVDSLQYSPTWYLDYETGLEYAILPFEQTFDDAAYSCSTYTTSQIASLASINSKRENEILSKFVLPMQGNTSRQLWLGMRVRPNFAKYRNQPEKQWYNIDGSEFSILSDYYRPSFKACLDKPSRKTCCRPGVNCLFAPGQPNRRGEGIYKTCMAVDYSGSPNRTSLWNDMRCTNKMYFVCKRVDENWDPNAVSTLPETTQPAPTTGSDVVDDGFVVDPTPGPNDLIYPSVFLSERYPYGIAGSGSVVYFAVENDHKIYRYNVRPSGTLQIGGKFGSFGSGNGHFNVPLALALSPNNQRLYVVDSGNCRIQAINPTTGAFIRSFGSCGDGSGQFRAPKGIAVAANGDILVTDGALNRIQRFTSNGAFIDVWGVGQLNAPNGLTFLADGTLAVCDTRNHRVVLYHKLNNKAVLRTFGQNGIQPTEFKLPTSVTQNPTDGTLYIAEFGNNRVQVLNPDGSFVKFVGSSDTLVGPTNVFIRNNVLFVSSTLGNRVVFFRA